MIRIRANQPQRGPSFAELWSYRELLLSFCSREMLVRHKQTLLGSGWLVLQPLLHAVVFALFMHRLARVPSDGAPYALFAYTGLLPWLFFSNGVQSLSYGLMMNSHLVSRVYFPRVLIPLAMVLVRLLDFAVAVLVFLTLTMLLGVNPSGRLLLLPVLMIQSCFLTLGIGAWCSCLISRYRDFGTLLPAAFQIAMFASPVIYPSSLVPEAWRPAYFLNPMAAVIESFRACVFGTPFPTVAWAISVAITAFLTAILGRQFSRMEARAVETL